MRDVSQHSVRTRLAPTADAPAQARDFFAASCRGWATPQYLEAGTLAISELVTNAVLHAGTEIRVELILTGAGLTVAVHDGGDGEPLIVPPDRRLLGGRGLAMVAKISAAWGVHATDGGKTVWCRFDVAR